MGRARRAARGCLRSLLLLLASSLVCLVLGALVFEVFLRIQIPSLFLYYFMEQSDRERFLIGVERMFLDLHPNGIHEKEESYYDPDLGWDIPRPRLAARPAPNFPEDFSREDLFKIVTIGDSFTEGVDVEDDETYSFYLQELLPGSGVLNLGVSGYGIDQAQLKYEKYGRQHEPDLVVFGIYVEMFLRAGLPLFYFNRKPLYRYDPATEEVVLTGVPVPPPQLLYDELKQKYRGYEHPLRVRVFLRDFYTYVVASEKTDEEREADEQRSVTQYYREMELVISHILSQLVTSTQATGSQLLIVDIPPKSSFQSEEALEAKQQEPMRTTLLRIYENLDIPYVDLLPEFEDRFATEEAYEKLYTEHLTPLGNQLVASLVLDWMQATIPDRLPPAHPPEAAPPSRPQTRARKSATAVVAMSRESRSAAVRCGATAGYSGCDTISRKALRDRDSTTGASPSPAR